jgi:hypothetical protein
MGIYLPFGFDGNWKLGILPTFVPVSFTAGFLAAICCLFAGVLLPLPYDFGMGVSFLLL